ncbi:single-stranded DNA-binding protein [Nocardioides acrostichi]|uniref:Single-stranded DNA-binding protein n=1 Tax=Nocardioides acrostichi TaxID=2784339 RepID=A0A930V170_9ACTN|nr:single-stranded DNA-binding protein [Nocardioides acrostichi]MBF4163826.1 single-stranded DNA-binding protein [Nocardioides acrostichi]
MHPEEETTRNEVVVRGRLSAPAEERELPSGDVVVTLRVIVSRARPRGPSARSKQRFDVIDCAVWAARLRRTVRAWRAGDVVEVEGALRRRFYRGAAGTTSRVEVEAARARRISAAVPASAS